MKAALSLLAALTVASSAIADIHDPPANDYGPTRKLGRGLSNFFFAPAEIFVSEGEINTKKGNSAAAGYGMVRGLSRSAIRHVAGFVEAVTAPFPINRGTFYPILPSDIPNVHGGFKEFPPELGNESKYQYVRDY